MSHNDDYRHAWTPNDDVDSDDLPQAGGDVVGMPHLLDLLAILRGLGLGAGVLGLVGASLFIQGDTVDPGDPEDGHCAYHLKRCLNTKLGKKNSGSNGGKERLPRLLRAMQAGGRLADQDARWQELQPRSRPMTTKDEYLEQSNRILASTDSRSFDDLSLEIQSLETRFSTGCRDSSDRAQLAEDIADLHLTVAVIKKEPLGTCLPLAERVLETTKTVPFHGLQSIGVFARYALDCDPGVGLRVLERALERIDWARAKIKLPHEARSAYERLAQRLRDAARA